MCAVLRLSGEIDPATLLGFRVEADVLLLDDTVRELVVDPSETTLLDWTGLSPSANSIEFSTSAMRKACARTRFSDEYFGHSMAIPYRIRWYD